MWMDIDRDIRIGMHSANKSFWLKRSNGQVPYISDKIQVKTLVKDLGYLSRFPEDDYLSDGSG